MSTEVGRRYAYDLTLVSIAVYSSDSSYSIAERYYATLFTPITTKFERPEFVEGKFNGVPMMKWMPPQIFQFLLKWFSPLDDEGALTFADFSQSFLVPLAACIAERIFFFAPVPDELRNPAVALFAATAAAKLLSQSNEEHDIDGYFSSLTEIGTFVFSLTFSSVVSFHSTTGKRRE